MSAADQHILDCSPFLDGLVRRYPEWLAALRSDGRLEGTAPPRRQDLDRETEAHGLNAGLRRFRNREMLRICWRELGRLAPLEETLGDLSSLAEICLQAALAHHHARLVEKFGTPVDDQGVEVPLAALAMGKLGGGELNLSSDIDLVFAYARAGSCDGRHRLSNEQFFTRLVRAVIRDLSEINEHGFCFRVDTRLRPFGESGPLVCSFGAMEQYYQREGRDWERYALIKARPVAGALDAGQALLKRLRPFVFRRYIDFGVIEALHEMHDALRSDAARHDRANDVKRGPGGIREIEFLVQAFQLLRGGREPALQTPSLSAALALLKESGDLPAPLAEDLERDYRFLRQVENAIQALHDQQGHALPEGDDNHRVRRTMALAGHPDFEAELAAVRARVSRAFEACFPRNNNPQPDTATPWQSTILEASDGGALDRFVQALSRYSLSARARKRLDRLMPLLLERLREKQRTLAVSEDVFNLLLTICRRSAYLALLYQNPQALDRMLGLFGISDWVAAAVIRHPALLDELIDPALGQALPDAREMQQFAQRLLDSHDDPEQALLSLNDAKQAFHLRIAVAELESSLSVHEVQLALTAVAGALVECCYRLAQRAVQDKHGKLQENELAIIGYGTLGASTLSYDSDLDLIFLYQPCDEPSDGARPLDAETYHTVTVRRLLNYLTSTTTSGRLFDVDTRLRPNGRSGLLVSSLKAFEKYQLQQAWTWELQALCRGRPVAGSRPASEAFDEIRLRVLSAGRDPHVLREDVLQMRQRMRDAHHRDDTFKHGDGGLVDIEFVAQLGLLLNGCQHPGCLSGNSTLEQLRALREISWLSNAQFDVLSQALSELTAARHLKLLCGGRQDIALPASRAAEVCAQLLGTAQPG